MSPVIRPRGLRGRVVFAFGVGALVVCAVFALSTYGLALSYLLNQREHSVLRQSYRDATLVRGRLETAGADVPAILTAVDPASGGSIVVRWHGRWFSSSLDAGKDSIPAALRRRVDAGLPASMRTEVGQAPRLIVGVPLPAVGAAFHEVAALDELRETLRILGAVLVGGAVVAAAAGAGLGMWASRSVVHPLNAVASTAAQIAAGQLGTRLSATRDPDLAAIVGSFNSMVDTLQQRIDRDARLAADVSHELRSPLTTLVASVDVLNNQRDSFSPVAQKALDLVTDELGRFRRLLDNLLELSQVEAGIDQFTSEAIPISTLVSHTLVRSGRDSGLVSGRRDLVVHGDKLRLERVFANLFDNAEMYGHGLCAVSVALADQDQVLVLVDDAGPGVPHDDRERIFDRFATGRTPRGSSSGTGIGLALVRETVAAHHGAVWCTERPGGGARFVVSLPRVAP